MQYEPFEIYARTDNYEEYTMKIVARDYEQAEQAAEVLCQTLGLILMGVYEPD